jgi:hypothetical protein
VLKVSVKGELTATKVPQAVAATITLQSNVLCALTEDGKLLLGMHRRLMFVFRLFRLFTFMHR